MKMTLLKQIQNGATDNAVPLSKSLRRASILATRLGHEPLKNWVQLELNGYPDIDQAPDYRIVREAQVLGDFAGSDGARMTNTPLDEDSVPSELRDSLSILFMHWWSDGVGVLEDLVRRESGSLIIPWPADAVRILEDRFFDGYRLMTARAVVSRGTVVTVLETVRNRLLEFALEIEALNPDAGEAMSEQPIPPRELRQVFNTTISGGQNSIAVTAAGDINQSSVRGVRDWEGAAQQLLAWGVPTEEVHTLQEAFEGDGRRVAERTQGWLRSFAEKVEDHALEVAAAATTAGITDLLLQIAA